MRIKPDVRFPFYHFGINSIWLESDYREANSIEDLIGLVHKWFSIAENSTNTVRANNYQQAAQVLFSIITNKSYEFNLNI